MRLLLRTGASASTLFAQLHHAHVQGLASRAGVSRRARLLHTTRAVHAAEPPSAAAAMRKRMRKYVVMASVSTGLLCMLPAYFYLTGVASSPLPVSSRVGMGGGGGGRGGAHLGNSPHTQHAPPLTPAPAPAPRRSTRPTSSGGGTP